MFFSSTRSRQLTTNGRLPAVILSAFGISSLHCRQTARWEMGDHIGVEGVFGANIHTKVEK